MLIIKERDIHSDVKSWQLGDTGHASVWRYKNPAEKSPPFSPTEQQQLQFEAHQMSSPRGGTQTIMTPLQVHFPPSRPLGIQKARQSPRNMPQQQQVITSPRGGSSSVTLQITQDQMTTSLTNSVAEWSPWGDTPQTTSNPSTPRTPREQSSNPSTPRTKITLEEILN